MLCKEVKLEKTVDYKTLEAALCTAAKELGWNAEVKDRYAEFYKLGSVKEERQYKGKEIKLEEAKGRLFGRVSKHTVLEISVHDCDFWGNQYPIDNFFISTPFSLHSASRENIEKYLCAVSRNLQGS